MTLPLHRTLRFLSRTLAIAGLALGVAGPLRAASVEFPDDEPSIRFTLPNGWKSTDLYNGTVECTPAEGQLSFILMSGKGLAEPKVYLPMFASAMAKAGDLSALDQPEVKDGSTRGGVKYVSYSFPCKKAGMPYRIFALVFLPAKGDPCVLLWPALENVFKADQNLGPFIDSVKPALHE